MTRARHGHGRRCGWLLPVRFARHPSDVRNRDDEDDHGDHPGQRGAVAGIVILEGLEIHPGAEHLGRPAGPAIGHRVDDVEDLERLNDRQRQHDDVGLGQARQGDVAEGLPGVGAVESCRLVILLRDRLQTGEVEDHRKADMAPDLGDEGGGQRRVVVGKPAAGEPVQADGLEGEVHRAEVRIVHPRPDQADRDQRQHRGAVEDGAKDDGTAQPAVERQAPGRGRSRSAPPACPRSTARCSRALPAPPRRRKGCGCSCPGRRRPCRAKARPIETG